MNEFLVVYDLRDLRDLETLSSREPSRFARRSDSDSHMLDRLNHRLSKQTGCPGKAIVARESILKNTIEPTPTRSYLHFQASFLRYIDQEWHKVPGRYPNSRS